jgi:hypothetical protein
METICTIREFKTRNFRIIIDAVWDDDLDLSWDDTGEVAAKLETGDLMAFCVRARVFCASMGEVASDFLGGCIYSDPSEFQDHRRCAAETRKLRESGSKAVCGSYFADMVRTVCREAREHIKGTALPYVRA